MDKKVLITNFEPFGNRNTNASMELVSALSSFYSTLKLPVNYLEVEEIIKDKISKLDLDYLFLVGEAGNYHDLTIELVAHNIAKGVDNSGFDKNDEEIIQNGNNLYTSMVFDFNKLDVLSSYDAGKYLCNYSYYLALSYLKKTKVVFIHTPYIKDESHKKILVNKLKSIIDYSLNNDINIIKYDMKVQDALDIRLEVFVKEQGYVDEFDAIDDIATHFVAYKNKIPVATARLFFDKSVQKYHLGRVATLKEYRHFGVGSMMIKEIEKYLISINIHEVILGSQIIAKEFYKKNGFKEYGEIYLDEGQPHIMMIKCF